MASPLTVTSTAAGVTSTKGFGNQPADDAGDALGVFAALLGNTAASDKVAAADAGAAPGNLVDLAFGFGNGQAGDAKDPEAIAAVIDAPLAPVTADAKAAFADLIDGLASLKARLDAGEPLDPAELERLDGMLDELVAALGIDLAQLPALDELKAMLAGGDATTSGQLTAALQPLAETLLGGKSDQPDLAELIKSIGDKLAGLLKALNGDGGLDPAKLAALGLDADASIDADLKAALARLTTPPAEPATPVLATPELKLTEPTLTGKAASAEAAPSSADTAVTAQATAGDDNKSDTGDKPRDPKAFVAIVAADTRQPDPQAVTQTPPQASRIDATAAPRVIQAGYQTSQQQLNLPQLAFELVRQVNGGNTRFQIRLDPPELGKIDVRLDIDQAGQVTARLTVEKAETLDLMQRDQRGLERALQQAGLDGAKTNLEFSLKQNPFSGGQQQERDGQGRFTGSGADEETAEAPAPTVNLYRGSLTASGVNIIA